MAGVMEKDSLHEQTGAIALGQACAGTVVNFWRNRTNLHVHWLACGAGTDMARVVGNLEKTLRATLSRASTERPMQRWVEKNPLVLSACLQGIVYPNKLVSQFKFGTDFVADFVAFGAFSGACCFHFVELEPPGEALFTKAGVAAKRLNGALAQISAWKAYVEKHRDEVLRELSKTFGQRELVFGRDGVEPTDTTGMSLYDPQQWVIWDYHIVIGRRAQLTKSELGKKSSYVSHHKVDIMTYDRLLDQARVFDENPRIGLHERPIPKIRLGDLEESLFGEKTIARRQRR